MRPVLFGEYLGQSREQLLERLCAAVQEISGLHGELAMSQAQERQARAAAYRDSLSSTGRGRDMEADVAAVVPACSVLELRGALAALEVEKELLVLLIGLR